MHELKAELLQYKPSREEVALTVLVECMRHARENLEVVMKNMANSGVKLTDEELDELSKEVVKGVVKNAFTLADEFLRQSNEQP